MTKFHMPCLLLALSCTAAIGAPPDSPRPGGVATIPLGASSPNAPVAEFNGKRAMVIDIDGEWLAVVGIPLDQETGMASLTVSLAGDEPATRRFEISPHSYQEQRLTVERKYVDLSTQQLDRVTREREVIDAALGHWRDQPPETLALGAPVSGRRSSSFGLRRFFNEKPRSPHKGMDIAVPLGTPVAAPSAGIVSATGDFYFNGNTVIVDHGQGLVTLYCHLERIDVEEGEEVAAGTQLGEVGATGRVTGAHLHFATYLSGTAVDPAIFLPAPAG